jgi:hypothetical protein
MLVAASGTFVRKQACRVLLALAAVLKIQTKSRPEWPPQTLRIGFVSESTIHLGSISAACQLVGAKVY